MAIECMGLFLFGLISFHVFVLDNCEFFESEKILKGITAISNSLYTIVILQINNIAHESTSEWLTYRKCFTEKIKVTRVSAGFGTTSALGEISTAPTNCNSNPYEKKAKDIMK